MASASYAGLFMSFPLAFEDFLLPPYLWAPAWAAVVLLSFFLFEASPRPRLALFAWLARTVTSLTFVNYLNLFSNVACTPRFFNDALVNALHGAGLSGLLSLSVASAVSCNGRRLRRRC